MAAQNFAFKSYYNKTDQGQTYKGLHDIQHNDTQYEDIQHNETRHKELINDYQHNNTLPLCCMSLC
jgi:hypothetical protein